MNQRSELPGFVALLSLFAASACSSQATPAPAAQPPIASAAPSASASASPMPVLTPTGVVSAQPPPTTAASDSATPASPGPRLSPDGKLCGGIAGFQCPEKHYCSFATTAHCGAGDMAGTCKPIPDLCTMEFAPVCGCDGKTYSTACVAGRSGVSVASNGSCAAEGAAGKAIADGKTCGTRGVPGDCEKGSYCAYRTQCGATDAGGKCTKKPELCPHLVAPVCGCNNQTYNNGCEAARAGFSVSSPGACKTK